MDVKTQYSLNPRLYSNSNSMENTPFQNGIALRIVELKKGSEAEIIYKQPPERVTQATYIQIIVPNFPTLNSEVFDDTATLCEEPLFMPGRVEINNPGYDSDEHTDAE